MSNYSSFMQDLSLISTIKMGGISTNFYVPRNREDAIALCTDLHHQSKDFVVVGNLSNTLFRSGTISTAIISARLLTLFEFSGNILYCQPGVQLSVIAKYLSSIGISCFNALSGIPSTIGGAVVNNSGSYGATISDFLFSVEFIDQNGKIRTLSASQLKYSWRSSIFKSFASNFMLLSCSFKINSLLCSNTPSQINAAKLNLQKHLSYRYEEQKCRFPNLGSTFATEDLLWDLVQKKAFYRIFVQLTRKIIGCLPFTQNFKLYLTKMFNKYTIYVLSGFSSHLYTRMAYHNCNVFLKTNFHDSPEDFFGSMQFLMSRFDGLNPEVNLYLDLE